MLLEAFVELTDVHAVDLLALVRLGIDLPDLGRVIDRAAEVELAMVFHGVAEADVVLRVSFRAAGEQDLHLAGFDVELDERTTGGFAVCFLREEVTVKNDVQDAGQKLGVILVAEAAVHQLDGLTQGVVEKARVDPVAIAYGRPGVGLAAAAGIVRAANVGAEDAVAGVINKAVVCSASARARVRRDLRVGQLYGCLAVSGVVAVRKACCIAALGGKGRCREQSHDHDHGEQDAQDPFVHVCFLLLFMKYSCLLFVCRERANSTAAPDLKGRGCAGFVYTCPRQGKTDRRIVPVRRQRGLHDFVVTKETFIGKLNVTHRPPEIKTKKRGYLDFLYFSFRRENP